MVYRYTGINALGYLGVQAPNPPNFVSIKRDPTTKDYTSFAVGDIWLNNSVTPQRVWILVSKLSSPTLGPVATWIRFAGGLGDVVSLTGDTGGPVFPDINGNINTLGTPGQIHVTGNPATFTLTWSLDGSVANEYTTDDGNHSFPVANNLNVFSAIAPGNVTDNLFTRSAPPNGDTVTVELNNSILQPNTNSAGTTGVYALGTTNNYVNNRFLHNYGTANTFVGSTAGNMTLTVADAVDNVGIGTSSLLSLTTGPQNSCLGAGAGGAITSGSANTCIGYLAGSNYTTEVNNISIGTDAPGVVGETGLIWIAGSSVPTYGNNIFIGQDSGNTTYTLGSAGAFQNVGIGTHAFSSITTAQHNAGVGSGIFKTLTTGSLNSAFGDSALAFLTTGSTNTVGGATSMISLSTGSGNTAFGYAAMYNLATGSNNVAVGYNAGFAYTTTESGNIVIGEGAVGIAGETGTIRIQSPGGGLQNCFIGMGAIAPAYTVGTAHTNTGVGSLIFGALTTGSTNVAIGAGALGSLTTGSTNTAVASMGFVTTGSSNVGVGGALAALVTGSNNTAMGYQSALNYTGAESYNISIGAGTAGVTGESNTLRIGAATGGGVNQINQTFIAGITGIGVAGAAVLVTAGNQLGVAVSSIRYKENVEDIGDFHEEIMRLRPVTFKYKNESTGRKCIGLIAEEVHDALPDLVDYNKYNEPETVRYNELPILLLNELQKLVKRVNELEERCKCK